MENKIEFTKFEKYVLVIEIIALIIFPVVSIMCMLDVCWEAISSMVGAFAMVISIITIIYTENARKKQNIYEYNKNKVEKSIDTLRDVLYEQINNLSPSYLMDMSLSFSKPEENVGYLTSKVLSYKTKLAGIQSKIYWQYNDEQYKKAEKLKKFMNKFNKAIIDIDEQLNIILSTLDDTIKKANESINQNNSNLEKMIDIDIIKDMNLKLEKPLKVLVNYNYNEIETLYLEAKQVIEEYEKILLSNIKM